MFTLFANLIALHLDAQERLDVSRTALLDERQRIEVQDQFIAVLGHDLRNPLSAVQTGAKMLLSMPLDKRAGNIAQVIDRSAARMAGLIDNVLDFARGRLGGGLTVTLAIEPALDTMLEQVVTEMRTARPDRTIESDVKLTGPVLCDRVRIGQLLSNLLANALTHGDQGGPVSVRARSGDEGFELSVTNRGEPIPPGTMERLFQPFVRAPNQRDQGGLGLGLYIVSEIARAHGGRLEVESSPEQTRFTFRIPSP
jgi:signal transduction histidine kinase